MKHFLVWPIILLTYSSFAQSCHKDVVTIDKNEHSVCREGKYALRSVECKTLEDCFKVKGLKFNIIETQSPGYTLCEKIGGKGMQGIIKSSKARDSYCLLDNKIIDMNQLLQGV